ncbi:glycosyltransferase [Enterocloster aldenensis]|uniref:glycosyltransferase n=1 Tax=Enterocloster aldenensis TaxID=358742 RepID=UPI000E484B67|nr:glycosyltransferase [Enterocloster aldenensis]
MSNLPGLVYCIPTYNRSAMIEEFLEQFALIFYHLGIDICLYDSSEDNTTELVIKRWKSRYKNITYIRIPSDWHANHKVMYIYEQYAQTPTYDYIWICGDSVRHSEKILKQIIGLLNSGYDMVVINGIDKGRIGTREYTDGNKLFQECAWHMTLFGAAIVNVHTILENTQWSYIEEKYEIPERINYSHIGLYFESIYRMDKFRAYYLAADQEVWGSQLKRKAGWYQDAFQVLCEYWPSTVNALPSYYTEKQSVINKLGYYSCLEPCGFLNFRSGHVYNIHTFLKYRKILIGMSRLNTFQLWSLACLNPKVAYYLATNGLNGYVKECQKIHRLHNYCKGNQKIYIYGAGIVAKRYAVYLERKRIIYQGFLVTQKDNNPETLQDHPVIPLCQFKPYYDRVRVIIGLNKKNMEEIQPMLMEHGIWEHSFHEYIEPVMLMDWKDEEKNL